MSSISSTSTEVEGLHAWFCSKLKDFTVLIAQWNSHHSQWESTLSSLSNLSLQQQKSIDLFSKISSESSTLTLHPTTRSQSSSLQYSSPSCQVVWQNVRSLYNDTTLQDALLHKQTRSIEKKLIQLRHNLLQFQQTMVAMEKILKETSDAVESLDVKDILYAGPPHHYQLGGGKGLIPFGEGLEWIETCYHTRRIEWFRLKTLLEEHWCNELYRVGNDPQEGHKNKLQESLELGRQQPWIDNSFEMKFTGVVSQVDKLYQKAQHK